jgi:hypothetical protein
MDVNASYDGSGHLNPSQRAILTHSIGNSVRYGVGLVLLMKREECCPSRESKVIGPAHNQVTLLNRLSLLQTNK